MLKMENMFINYYDIEQLIQNKDNENNRSSLFIWYIIFNNI